MTERRCHLTTRLCSGEVRLFAVDGTVKGLCAWHSVGFRPANENAGVKVTTVGQVPAGRSKAGRGR